MTVDARLEAAHRALRADPAVQFDLQPSAPPPKPPQWWLDFVDWLAGVLRPLGEMIGRFFAWIGGWMPDAPYARILLWTVIALVLAGALWLCWERLRHGRWRLPRRRAAMASDALPEEDWAPEAAPARAWLKEADALAAEGRYADAVHHLLIRSVEDIGRRRPGVVRPALTSRDLARADAIPAGARGLFAGIAAVVERSLFGGRPVGEADWGDCRQAYADFAQSRNWAQGVIRTGAGSAAR